MLSEANDQYGTQEECNQLRFGLFLSCDAFIKRRWVELGGGSLDSPDSPEDSHMLTSWEISILSATEMMSVNILELIVWLEIQSRTSS